MGNFSASDTCTRLPLTASEYKLLMTGNCCYSPSVTFVILCTEFKSYWPRFSFFSRELNALIKTFEVTVDLVYQSPVSLSSNALTHILNVIFSIFRGSPPPNDVPAETDNNIGTQILELVSKWSEASGSADASWIFTEKKVSCLVRFLIFRAMYAKSVYFG